MSVSNRYNSSTHRIESGGSSLSCCRSNFGEVALPKKTSKAAQQAQKSKKTAKRRPLPSAVAAPPRQDDNSTPATPPPTAAASGSQPFKWPTKPVKSTRTGPAPAGLGLAEEYRFIRGDVMRTVWLAIAMFAIIAILAVVLH
jgi:hypothetical protein